ncbi:AAA family ATPase [Brevundimonas sp. S30B]|uniref:AAA family ATPase n=1 Tax=unclassified Brevundimonas TaxID=2622653 RepID=UPI001071A355|nr:MULTISPECIES: AAA family ATPase [unclassified Brevundimonas]QBX38060.1 AAA family ATPase [Brevundimonas sp. MF30-B]TFW02586.1 AAA family ATPase [Brevundimonas sp. S30B]
MSPLERPYWLEARFERQEDWDEEVYPFNLPVLRGLESLAFHPHVTFFVGENGSGKSTLIEALAVAWGFNAEGGSRDHQYSTRASHSALHRYVRPVRAPIRVKDGYFFRAESFFTTATYLEASGASRKGQARLHEQSHGESFFDFFENRLEGDGLYIMDEPEAALSPSRQLSFLARLHQLVAARSQFIIATHSPILLAYPDAWIYQASAHGLERVAYEDTEHFQVTRSFLNRPETYLDILMSED